MTGGSRSPAPAAPGWTAARADAALQWVAPAVARAQVEVERAEAGRPGRSDPRLVLGGLIELLAGEGIVLRDPARGLVDFPARAPSGRPYWLCWLVGEPSVLWWHWVEDGFAGRTPLERPPT